MLESLKQNKMFNSAPGGFGTSSAPSSVGPLAEFHVRKAAKTRSSPGCWRVLAEDELDYSSFNEDRLWNKFELKIAASLGASVTIPRVATFLLLAAFTPKFCACVT